MLDKIIALILILLGSLVGSSVLYWKRGYGYTPWFTTQMLITLVASVIYGVTYFSNRNNFFSIYRYDTDNFSACFADPDAAFQLFSARQVFILSINAL